MDRSKRGGSLNFPGGEVATSGPTGYDPTDTGDGYTLETVLDIDGEPTVVAFPALAEGGQNG